MSLLKDHNAKPTPSVNAERLITLFPDDKDTQLFLDKCAQGLDKIKNDPKGRWHLADSRTEHSKLLDNIKIPPTLLKKLIDKKTEIEQKLTKLNKDISLHRQALSESKNIIKSAQANYAETFISENKQEAEIIENDLVKHQENIRLSEARISAIQTAITRIKASLVPLEDLSVKVNYRLKIDILKEFKIEYLKHFNEFKKHYQTYLNKLDDKEFHRIANRKDQIDHEIHRILELDPIYIGGNLHY